MTMQEQKEKMAEKLNRLPSIIADTIKAAKEIPDHKSGYFYTTTPPGEVRVDLPRAKGLVVEYLRMIARQGSWKRENPNRNPEASNGDLYYFYRHRELNVELTICFDADHESATCRLKQTGFKKVSVFEVICDEEPENVPDTV